MLTFTYYNTEKIDNLKDFFTLLKRTTMICFLISVIEQYLIGLKETYTKSF